MKILISILFFLSFLFQFSFSQEKEEKAVESIGKHFFVPWKGNTITQSATKQGETIIASFSLRVEPKSGLVELSENKAIQVELVDEQEKVIATSFGNYSPPSTAKIENKKIQFDPPSKRKFDVTASFDAKKLKDGKYSVRISNISFYFSKKKEEWKPNGEGWDALVIEYKKPVPKSRLDELQEP